MISTRQLFLNHIAQTSPTPLALEISHAEGSYMYGADHKKYLDFISGISVSNVGHRHAAVVKAIKNQLDKYMHLMVYGELIQSPQVALAQKITSLLPPSLNSCYFVNSGSEAVEGALKLAKRFTARPEMVSFKNAYHGSTAGALSVMGDEFFKQAFRPLIPGIKISEFNNEESLNNINENTACVIVETVQAEAGVILPHENFLNKLRNACDKNGALLIFDEAQCGMGRTGTFFAFEKYKVVPDILILAKALGGGMPLGAFISSQKIMSSLSDNPVLGHITTFGGHPVSCAAALAGIKVLEDENLIAGVEKKAELIKQNLKSDLIKTIRNAGLLMAVEFEDEKTCKKTITKCIEAGVLTDWFLFNDKCMRIAPPLTITGEEIEEGCAVINSALETIA